MARTLDDLARLSGVSRATVSRVINGGPVAAAERIAIFLALHGLSKLLQTIQQSQSDDRRLQLGEVEMPERAACGRP